MSDHDIGFVNVDEWDHSSFAVPIHHFDFSGVDSPEDMIKQLMLDGSPVLPLVNAWANHIADTKQIETIRFLFSLIQDADNPKRKVDEVMFACGVSFKDKPDTLETIASRYGVEKQAVHRCVKTIRERLSLRKTRTMRSETARKNMSEAYWNRQVRK